MTDDVIIICDRHATATPASMVPGTITVECDTCKEAIVLSPSSRRIMEEDDAVTRCMFCALEMLDEDYEIAPITEDQMIELNGPSIADMQ